MEINRITVIGSGSMGSGIAQVFARSGYEVSLFDAQPRQLEAAVAGMARSLEKEVGKGALRTEEAAAVLARVATHADLGSSVAGSDLVLEAIVENMAAKKELFSLLDAACRPGTILASNTSSLSISEMGLAAGRPEAFVGMHFFNPPQRMKLVEVIRGAETSQGTIDTILGIVARIGKTPVLVHDFPNFIVNRIARPLYLQAQLLLSDGIPAQEIDKALRLGAGLPMGPLELLDMIGLEPHLAASETAFHEWSDQRFRPVPIVKRMVRAGHVGRRRGRGFYRYLDGKQIPLQDSTVLPEPTAEIRSVVVLGESGDAAELVAGLSAAGCGVTAFAGVEAAVAELGGAQAVIAADEADQRTLVELFRRLGDLCSPATVLLPTSTYAFPDELGTVSGNAERVVGLNRPMPFLNPRFFQVGTGPDTGEDALALALALVASLGGEAVVTPHRACYLVHSVLIPLINEAAFAVLESLASREDIDMAMRLGLNHPMGPLEWADRLGIDVVLKVMETLHEEYGDSRYRPCILLKQMVRAGQLGRKSGRGFYACQVDEAMPGASVQR